MSGWLPGFLLALAPLLVFIGLLIHGSYPGEATIQKVRRVLTRVFSVAAGGQELWSISNALPRPLTGGRLIANSLAGRAPPLHL